MPNEAYPGCVATRTVSARINLGPYAGDHGVRHIADFHRREPGGTTDSRPNLPSFGYRCFDMARPAVPTVIAIGGYGGAPLRLAHRRDGHGQRELSPRPNTVIHCPRRNSHEYNATTPTSCPLKGSSYRLKDTGIDTVPSVRADNTAQ